MSKHTKVDPDRDKTGGRLTLEEMARGRVKRRILGSESDPEADAAHDPSGAIGRGDRVRRSGRVIAAGRSASRTGIRHAFEAPLRAAKSASAKSSTSIRRVTATRSPSAAPCSQKASGLNVRDRKR